jgi:hypothetical protein
VKSGRDYYIDRNASEFANGSAIERAPHQTKDLFTIRVAHAHVDLMTWTDQGHGDQTSLYYVNEENK